MKSILLLFVLILIACNSKKEIKREYYSNGKLKLEYTMINGLKNGYQKEFDENGELMSIVNVIDGAKEGYSITYRTVPLVQILFYENDTARNLNGIIHVVTLKAWNNDSLKRIALKDLGIDSMKLPPTPQKHVRKATFNFLKNENIDSLNKYL